MKCPDCEKTRFKTHTALANHQRAKHPVEGDCPLCGHAMGDHYEITEMLAQCIHCTCDLSGHDQ